MMRRRTQPRSANMPTQLSPIKSKRLDEKTSLQSLNSRLELYVSRVKDMEEAKNIAEKELEHIRVRMQSDMDAMKARLHKELDDTRKKLDQEMEARGRLQLLEQEQHQELVKLRAQVKELVDAKTLADQLSAQLQKEKADAKSAKEALSAQTTQLQSARRRVKDLERDQRSLEAALSDATKELEHFKKKSADIDLVRDQEISSIRKELNAKHQETLAQWKKDAEERIQGVEKEVRNYFEGVVQGYKNQVEDLTTELEATKKEFDRTANDYEESLKLRESLSGKLAQVERDYREDRKKFKEDRKVYEINLEKLRLAKTTKEQEFNDLMDVKIALDAEISAYRRILDREETRVGMPLQRKNAPASKKRKSDGLDSASSKRSKRAPSVDYSSVHITQLDLEKDRIVIENSGDKPVALGNWEVRGRSESQVFRIPADYVLKQKNKMIVYSNKRVTPPKETEKKKDEDLFLSRKFSFDASGDFAVLTTDDGEVVSTKAQGLSADEVRALEEELMNDEAPPAEGCGVM
ncbi:TPA: hypothetical protein N0F65_012636 [Lagenidium giganteum]|uniref:LTD domain-containing protein n=1 Tax=Lagenidium giganteum TaxID=4803 RepID=A0AAV2YHJ5_9STRA|nr:TPA: hypothetical protein N0F65_012636 [Lagenidium giganteum]